MCVLCLCDTCQPNVALEPNEWMNHTQSNHHVRIPPKSSVAMIVRTPRLFVASLWLLAPLVAGRLRILALFRIVCATCQMKSRIIIIVIIIVINDRRGPNTGDNYVEIHPAMCQSVSSVPKHHLVAERFVMIKTS
jgi:hypothetical protein